MSSETTPDHDRIREWAEALGGRPSVVRTRGEHAENRGSRHADQGKK